MMFFIFSWSSFPIECYHVPETFDQNVPKMVVQSARNFKMMNCGILLIMPYYAYLMQCLVL